MSKTNTQNCEYWKSEIFQMVSMIQSETAIHRIYNHVVQNVRHELLSGSRTGSTGSREGGNSMSAARWREDNALEVFEHTQRV